MIKPNLPYPPVRNLSNGRTVSIYVQGDKLIVHERERSIKEGWMDYNFPLTKKGIEEAIKLFKTMR